MRPTLYMEAIYRVITSGVTWRIIPGPKSRRKEPFFSSKRIWCNLWKFTDWRTIFFSSAWMIWLFLIFFVGQTWDDPDIEWIWRFLVKMFVILTRLQLSLLSFCCWPKKKGDEMWSLYAEKLRILAERLEEASRQTGRRGVLDCWGGWWWIVNIGWWTMD